MKKIAFFLVVAFSALSGVAQIEDNRELKEERIQGKSKFEIRERS